MSRAGLVIYIYILLLETCSVIVQYPPADSETFSPLPGLVRHRATRMFILYCNILQHYSRYATLRQAMLYFHSSDVASVALSSKSYDKA